jgi:hypothetical protein
MMEMEHMNGCWQCWSQQQPQLQGWQWIGCGWLAIASQKVSISSSPLPHEMLSEILGEVLSDVPSEMLCQAPCEMLSEMLCEALSEMLSEMLSETRMRCSVRCAQ